MVMKTGARRFVLISIFVCAGLAVSLQEVTAAGKTLRLENDSNSRLEVKHALVQGDATTIMFWTWPDRGDPNVKKDCAVNIYTLTLLPGLPEVEPTLLVKDACVGRAMLHGAVLEDGSGMFIMRDRLEKWRGNEKISSEPFSSMDRLNTLGINSNELGSQFAAFNPAGNVVLAIMINGYNASDWPATSTVIAGLTPTGNTRWLSKFNDTNESFLVENVWAGEDGSALLYVTMYDKTSILPSMEPRLLMITANGRNSMHTLLNVPAEIKTEGIRPGSIEDLQRALQQQDNNQGEDFGKLSARSRRGGGFDVLYDRESQDEDRDGYFLLRLAADGSIESEINLKSAIRDHGLDRWFDFYVDGNQLVLLSNYPVTQTGVNSNRNSWPQTIVSLVNLNTGKTESRLIPLDRQYLEAAMNAGDEGQQYLQGQPGGDPVLLTTLGSKPLSVSKGWIEKRGTLRIYEVTDNLVVFTEAYDKRQAELARQQKRQQRKADRQANQQRLDESLEEATGLSADELDSMSKEEQMMQVMKQGNMEAMMATLMQQAQSSQSGMTPDQAAQMQASMAQVQQMLQANGMAAPAAAISGQEQAKPQSAAKSGASFTVDALMRGHVQYDNGNGESVVLSIINRQNGEELTQKTYAGVKIDEYISLERFNLPVEQVGAQIKSQDGKVLEDLEAKK